MNDQPPSTDAGAGTGGASGPSIGNDHLQSVMDAVVNLLEAAGDLDVARAPLAGWTFEHYAMLCALVAQGQRDQTAISATQQMLTSHGETLIGLLQTLFALGYAHGRQDAANAAPAFDPRPGQGQGQG